MPLGVVKAAGLAHKETGDHLDAEAGEEDRGSPPYWYDCVVACVCALYCVIAIIFNTMHIQKNC